MSDYRRLISYIYEYEGKTKGKNIGFVKLEARNGQCRLNVNVKRVYVGGNAIGVYLLGSGGKKTFLGNMFVRNGNGEFRAMVDAVNVEGTGNSMDTYYGLTVHDVKNSWRSYQTIWDDRETVEAAEVANTGGVSEAAEVADAGGVSEAAEVADTGGVSEAAEVTDTGGVSEAVEVMAQDILPESNREIRELDVQAIIEELDKEISGENLLPSNVDQRKKVEEIEPEEQEAEIGQREAAEQEVEIGQRETTKLAEEVGRIEAAEPAAEPSIETMMISPELENPEVLRYLQETEQAILDPDALWQELRKIYPKIQPFDYDGGSEVLTIRPDDIGKLPRECWIYGNNSFLLHGYYNYRYLILVRLSQMQGRPRYLLGVPGHYYSNEKYMASMFGFPNFVLSKKQPPNDGRFGYWYTDIKMG